MICVDQVNESAITTCIKTNIICYSLHLLPPPLFSSSASISSIYSSTSFPLYPHPLSLPHSLILLLVLQSPSILPPLSTLSFLPPHSLPISHLLSFSSFSFFFHIQHFSSSHSKVE